MKVYLQVENTEDTKNVLVKKNEEKCRQIIFKRHCSIKRLLICAYHYLASSQYTVGYENQSVIGIVIGYGLDEEGSITSRGNRYRDLFILFYLIYFILFYFILFILFILFYFILFYLFYFILFYFILFYFFLPELKQAQSLIIHLRLVLASKVPRSVCLQLSIFSWCGE